MNSPMSVFDRLVNLSDDPVEFENERARIIDEMLQSIPKEHRGRAIEMQARLDILRETMPADAFLKLLMEEMSETARKMSNLMTELQEVLNITNK